MMVQLNPPMLFVTDDGRKCTALMALDYSPEHELLFLVGFDDTRELWILPHTRLRMETNISLGRMPCPPTVSLPT
jgi:hypothetical protein